MRYPFHIVLICICICICTCYGVVSAQTQYTFPLPSDIQQPILRYDPWSGELLLGAENSPSDLKSLSIPATWIEGDTPPWSPVYVAEELPGLSSICFGESGRIDYLDENTLQQGERLGDELLPLEEGASMPILLPNGTLLNRLGQTSLADSIFLAGIEAGKGFIYDLITEEWSSLPFNAGADNAYRVLVSQWVMVEDRTYVLFASDMPGGYGGLDVYAAEVTTRQKRGNRSRSFQFGPPLNLGQAVNTLDDEFDPNYDVEGQELCYLRSTDSREEKRNVLVVVQGFGWW